MGSDSHSTLDEVPISSLGIAMSSGTGSTMGGTKTGAVGNAAAMIGASGDVCVLGPKTNVSSLVVEDSATGGDVSRGRESMRLGGSADDGRLCSGRPDGSVPEVFSWMSSTCTMSSSIALISGVNCDPSGKVSETSSMSSSKASPFTDTGSLSDGDIPGGNCLEILDSNEEEVLLEVPVLEETSLAGSLPRPLTLSGVIVDVNMLFEFILGGASAKSGAKEGMGGGGDRDGIEPAKDAVIGGRLSNSGNAGAIETTLGYWRRPGFASESASSPLFWSSSKVGLGTDGEGDDTGEGASGATGATGESGFGSGLSNDAFNCTWCVLKAEGPSERS